MVGASDRDRDEQGRLDPYLPRAVLRHLIGGPPDGPATHTVEGTVLFTDISGFTKLSERLARRGREGAEELVGTIETSFSVLLAIAESNGGHLLKFGGDALLLLFEDDGHLPRACRAAIGMRRALRDLGELRTSAGRVRLRMSQGLPSGEFPLFLVGEPRRELLVAGAAATAVTRMEKIAEAGEIVVSDEPGALLAPPAPRPGRAGGRLLAGAPRGDLGELPHHTDLPSFEELALCLSTEVRAHVLSGHGHPEHRHVTTAFVKWDGTDALVRDEGPDATAAALHELVRDVQLALDQHEVCFLESDVDADGGKLMLTAGAPRMVGDDEERMLLALRRVVEGERRLPVRIGVNRGGAFTGDVGPRFRRSYSVMGDSVNLAARVMSKAPPGAILSTGGALERSATRFATTKLEPFAAKGKKELVQAWAVGHAIGSRSREGVAVRFPFVGRRRELGILDAALRSAHEGAGRLVEISGEPGIGKTRLVEELREHAPVMTPLQVTCEAYTASTPYATWSALLRPLIGARADDADSVVLELLGAEISERWPELETWLA